jgi:hypothetical protein
VTHRAGWEGDIGGVAELKGFRKLKLAPGETSTATFRLIAAAARDSDFQDRLLRRLAEVTGVELEGRYGAGRQTA